jgi:hypothetical protein
VSGPGRWVECPACDGDGLVGAECVLWPCDACLGDGFILERRVGHERRRGVTDVNATGWDLAFLALVLFAAGAVLGWATA